MKRTFIVALLACAALTSQAEEKLQIIELGAPDGGRRTALPPTTSTATADEAKDFIKRLDATVERGSAQIRREQVNAIERRKQAQDLAALKNEGEKFGVLFTPFHKCNEAAINAASSWQGLIFNDIRQFENGLNGYEDGRKECLQAISEINPTS